MWMHVANRIANQSTTQWTPTPASQHQSISLVSCSSEYRYLRFDVLNDLLVSTINDKRRFFEGVVFVVPRGGVRLM